MILFHTVLVCIISLLWRWSKVNEDISPSDSMGGEIHDGFPPQLTSIKHLTGRRTVKNTFRISSSSKLRCQSSSSSTEMGLLASTDSEVKAFRLIPNAVGQRGKTSKPWSWTDLIILFSDTDSFYTLHNFSKLWSHLIWYWDIPKPDSGCLIL